mgnify:CR=1 FL=1
MENTPKKLMRSVLWQKLVAFVEDHSVRTGLKIVGLFFFAGVVSAILTSPEVADLTFSRVMTWRNYTVPVTLWVLFLTFYGRRVYLWLTNSIASHIAFTEDVPDEDCMIEGIPVSDLVDHLVKFKTFKRDDIERKFLVPRYRYTALTKKLKELDVLTHGLNNMTVLGPEWNREKLLSLFAGRESADELEKTVNIVRPIPSPTPRFTRRRISEETAEESHVRPYVQPSRNLCETTCATA